MRIGELAARTGVSVHVLRVWERRYGLLTPTRSTGGYRLYGPSDERRVREAVRLRELGVPTVQAAAAALAASRQAAPPASERTDVRAGVLSVDQVDQLRERVLEAVAEFDDTAAHAALDNALEHLGVEETLREVVLPVLHETGNRWADGTLTVGQEHFVSNLVRGRLSTLALAWDVGTGPLAVLACPSGEQHDLGLLAFGVILGRAGWRVRYLGADTPVDTLASAVQSLRPDLVVLSGVQPGPLATAADEIGRLGESAQRALRATRLVVGGAGATVEVAERLGATRLTGDPVEAARLVVPSGERGR